MKKALSGLGTLQGIGNENSVSVKKTSTKSATNDHKKRGAKRGHDSNYNNNSNNNNSNNNNNNSNNDNNNINNNKNNTIVPSDVTPRRDKRARQSLPSSLPSSSSLSSSPSLLPKQSSLLSFFTRQPTPKAMLNANMLLDDSNDKENQPNHNHSPPDITPSKKLSAKQVKEIVEPLTIDMEEGGEETWNSGQQEDLSVAIVVDGSNTSCPSQDSQLEDNEQEPDVSTTIDRTQQTSTDSTIKDDTEQQETTSTAITIKDDTEQQETINTAITIKDDTEQQEPTHVIDRTFLADFDEWLDNDGEMEIGLQRGSGAEKNDDDSSYPYYYVRNFFIVLDHVMKKDKHLFLPEELCVVDQFSSLSDSAQRLFIRIFHRKGPWFAVSKLEYREIPDISASIAILNQHGYVDYHDMSTDGMASLLPILSVDQLREVLAVSKKPVTGKVSSMNREQLVKAIVEKEDRQLSLFTMMKSNAHNENTNTKLESTVQQLAGQCVKISHNAKEIFKRIHSLFFLNQQDNGNQVMLMVDFQKIRFPEYIVWGHSVVNNAITLEDNEERKSNTSNSYHDASSFTSTSTTTTSTSTSITSTTSTLDSTFTSTSTSTLDSTSTSTSTSTFTSTSTSTLDSTSTSVSTSTDPTSTPLLDTTPATNASAHNYDPTAVLNPASLFPTREALLAYETAVVFSNDMQRAIAEEKPGEALEIMQIASGFLERKSDDDICFKRPNYDFSVRFSASYVYCSIITVGISILESQKKYFEANELLQKQLAREECPGRRGDWWNRLAVNLSHLKRASESLSTCERALADPYVRSGDRLKLEKRLIRLCKPPVRWKVPQHLLTLTKSIRSPKKVLIRGKRAEAGTAGKKSVFKGYDGLPCSVEKFTKQFYSLSDDWEGVHDEGRTLLAIFCLLFWKVTYDSTVPHVFQTPYQTAPLDFGSDSYYAARKVQIDNLLESIQTGNAERILEQNWNANYGCQAKCVDWRQLSLEKLLKIVKCAGGEALSKLCKFLAQDLRSLDSGWPDLLLWRSSSASSDSGDLQIKLVEVKGPRDKLSEQQRITIDLLLSCGISVEICHIVDQVSSKDKYDDANLYYLLQPNT